MQDGTAEPVASAVCVVGQLCSAEVFSVFALLHERISIRFDDMLAAGFLEEVRALRADPRLHADLPSMRAVGYRQAWRHLAGEATAVEFREQAIAATRQLAKRQLTWLRARAEARWLDPGPDRAELEAAFRQFLGARAPV